MGIDLRLAFPAAIAFALTLAAAISFARGAEVTAGNLAITGSWARATPPGATVGAAYVTIENRGDADDRLLSVETPSAETAALHRAAEEGGMAAMRPLQSALVPAGGRLEMRPGGAHIMLSGLPAPLKEGDNFTLTLTFQAAGAVTVPVAVVSIGADGPEDGQGHRHPM